MKAVHATYLLIYLTDLVLCSVLERHLDGRRVKARRVLGGFEEFKDVDVLRWRSKLDDSWIAVGWRTIVGIS